MTDAPGAVFLSYASQDAVAAKRICDALRTAGVEVWFDQNELRGGDAWDQKIRRQIRECALFVPVISANTQARPEGYFRFEWKLAVDRSHLMADDQSFIVPVVVDDTSEASARVPDKFRDLQWTRLAWSETPAAFAARLRNILEGGNRIEADRGIERADTKVGRNRARTRARERGWRWWMIFPIGGMIMALVASLRPNYPPRRDRDGKNERHTKTGPSPVSEARQLMATAKALYEPWDGATREDFALAEQLLKRAVELDPTDGEVWAAYGLMLCGQNVLGLDRSPAKAELVRSVTERAVKLAPNAKNARLAQAFYFRFNPSTHAEAERKLRDLVEDAPADKLVLRTLGAALRVAGKLDEALTYFDRAIALPGGDPVAVYNKFLTLRKAGRHTEAEAVVDAALPNWPTPYLYRAKATSLAMLHGDLAGAAEMLGKIPPAFLLEDAGAFWASQVWLWRREPDKCLAVLRAVSRDIIEGDFGGPKTFLAGVAHSIAGRKEAARTEWKAGLQVVERQLAVEPNVPRWFFWQAHLLAQLGRLKESEAVLSIFEQLGGVTGVNDDTVSVYLLLGHHAEVLDILEKTHRRLSGAGESDALAIFQNTLRYDPGWDPLRDHARFDRLIARNTEQKAVPAAPAK